MRRPLTRFRELCGSESVEYAAAIREPGAESGVPSPSGGPNGTALFARSFENGGGRNAAPQTRHAQKRPQRQDRKEPKAGNRDRPFRSAQERQEGTARVEAQIPLAAAGVSDRRFTRTRLTHVPRHLALAVGRAHQRHHPVTSDRRPALMDARQHPAADNGRAPGYAAHVSSCCAGLVPLHQRSSTRLSSSRSNGLGR